MVIKQVGYAAKPLLTYLRDWVSLDNVELKVILPLLQGVICADFMVVAIPQIQKRENIRVYTRTIILI